MKRFFTLSLALAVAGFCFVGLTVTDAQAGDITELRLDIDKYYDHGVFSQYKFSIELEATGVDWASILTPAGTVLDLTPNGSMLDFTSASYSTLEDLQAVYPVGDYSLSVQYGSGGPLAVSNNLNYNVAEIGGFPQIIYPADGATDVSPNPTFSWTDCSAFASVLYLGVAELATGDDVYDELIMDNPGLTEFSPALDSNQDYNFWVGAVTGDINFNNDPTLATWSGGSDSFIYRALFSSEDSVNFSTVPEPATLSLLAVAGLAMLYRRRA